MTPMPPSAHPWSDAPLFFEKFHFDILTFDNGVVAVEDVMLEEEIIKAICDN